MEVGHVAGLVSVVMALLAVAVVVRLVAQRLHLPYTVLLVVAGMLAALVARSGPHWLVELIERPVSSDVILFVFLPTLVFESAFNLDARELRRNLLPILALAVPGLLISTVLIGTIVTLATPVELPAALLLGAILSATDPVAVVAIFKQLGAPERLTVLVEGESLFNDATAIVLARILTGIVIGTAAGGAALSGVADFLVVFGGGILVGAVLALIVGWLLRRLEESPFIEITLTILLAYASFLVAEDVFHVSGVMAVVVAGVTMGGWGRALISPSVESYLDHFWEHVAELANAMIFLLVGLAVNLRALVDNVWLLGWVLFGMLLSRGVVVGGLLPLVERLPGSQAIGRRYAGVIYWGGLRGAIALALVLSLPEEAHRDEFTAVVTGAVLFTLLAQGLTIERLVHWLGLDQPSMADRVARDEGRLAARSRALGSVSEMMAGGRFSARLAEQIERRCQDRVDEVRAELDQLHGTELDRDTELRLLFLRTFARERSLYHDLHRRGHLSEDAFRDLAHVALRQTETLRHGGDAPVVEQRPPQRGLVGRVALAAARRLGARWLVDRLQEATIARSYEHDWARHRAAADVLEYLDEVAAAGAMPADVVAEVRARWSAWRDAARERLDLVAEQLPEFVADMQERLAGRLLLHAERAAMSDAIAAGTVPEGVGHGIVHGLSSELRALRGRSLARLRPDPEELLRSVPFFREAPPEEIGRITGKLRQVLVPAGEMIVRQGEPGGSLYLIARGVVRVVRFDDEGSERDLATLIAGDFFGEMSLIHGDKRTATCRAATPCVLHELRRDDFLSESEALPRVRAELERVERARRAELEVGPDEAPTSGPDGGSVS